VPGNALPNPSDSTNLRAFSIIVVVSDDNVLKALEDYLKEFGRRMASIRPGTANGPDDSIEFRVI
jgi:hypothetical protein